jgi:hypothetical protein
MVSEFMQMPWKALSPRKCPGECIDCRQVPMTGNPNPRHISTSFVERQNLTMRMSMRRFTRLTNAFSKKVENLEHAVAIHYMWYNFARIHRTLRVTHARKSSAIGRSSRGGAWHLAGLL